MQGLRCGIVVKVRQRSVICARMHRGGWKHSSKSGVAGSNTFDYCKPDPRHLTSVIEILQGDIKKSLMIGDSETDSAAANSANLPFILLEDGYTDKKVNEIPHDHLVTNFQGIEKIVSKYLNT